MKNTRTIYQEMLGYLDRLSKDELLRLRRKLRLSQMHDESILITKKIRKKKKEEPKEYRERKEKVLVKEMEKVMKNEKY